MSKIDNVQRKLLTYLEQKNIKLVRETSKYIMMVNHVNSQLTLPIKLIDEELVLFLKGLYSIWNVIIDDELDMNQNSFELDSSFKFISNYRSNNYLNIENSKSVIVLRDILEPLRNHKYFEWVLFDFEDILHGLQYEKLINKEWLFADIYNYEKYINVTASPIIYFDIDYILAGEVIQKKSLKYLRKAYIYLGNSMKLASDIGSLIREIRVEKNLNIVLIKSIIEGKIKDAKFDILNLTDQEIFERFRDEINFVIQKSRKNLILSKEVFSKIGNHNFDNIVESVEKIINSYISGIDNFY